MAYVRPQVEVFQDLATVPTEIINPLRAWIAGPNANLHRYTVASEKLLIGVGDYVYQTGQTVNWPGRAAGGIVDPAYTKVHLDNALLTYYTDNISAGSLVTAVSGYRNRIKSGSVSFAANGAANPASGSMYDRGAKVGDHVYLRSVTGMSCVETTLDTTIIGFSGDLVAATTGVAALAVSNQADISSSTTIAKISGPSNCVTVTANGAAYSGLADGNVTEQYTITVVKSSIPGCAAAHLQVKSASGLDDVLNLIPNTFGVPTPIGTRGLFVTFGITRSGACSLAATGDGVGPEVLAVGQTWQVNVQQTFAHTTATAAGTYVGLNNDTYIVEVTKGGLFTASPTISVTTTNGLDHSGPTIVTAAATPIAVGTGGLTISFAGGTGLRKGDKYLITVTAAAVGPYNQLILQHDLPAVMLTATDLDLQLSIVANVTLTQTRASSSTTNWTQGATNITIAAGATATTPSWTVAGIVTPLPIHLGAIYIEYREWLQGLIDTVGSVQAVGDLDAAIPGPLDPDNPLKWGVYRALLQSNGTAVRFTSVGNPTLLSSWTHALGRVKGDSTLYNLVPLTCSADVKAAFAAQISDESGPTVANWKAGFLGLQAVSTKAAVSSTTTVDGTTVMATVVDNPQATGTQYTLLSTTNASANFLTNVVSGDTVRFLYTADAYGNPVWQEFTVDTVLSQTSLVLLSGTSVSIDVAQKVEIWHTLSKTEIVNYLIAQKSAYASDRICNVWPDLVGSGGTNEPGYFLCASLAGLVSGVAPNQGLTNVQITGFDDFSRSSGMFNSTQLDQLAAAGIWICVQDSVGNAYTRHALTGNMVDLLHREEMIRRNDDAINYFFYNRFAPFIGRCNASPILLTKLRYEFNNAIDYLVNVTNENLGGLLISGSIRTLQIDPILADRIDCIIDVVRPAPLNNLEIHLVG
jgi:hypothetical protein